jgi:6-hydroxymethylpterin diphosphokinase MptE-like
MLTPLKEAGTQDQIVPIDFVISLEKAQEHVDGASKRGLPECVFSQVTKPGKLAIVATGPSVSDYVEELRNWDGDIWGINGACGWLRHRDIKANAFVGVDPEEILKDYLETQEGPISVDTYYIASQAHPAVFDALKGKNVQLWHMSMKGIRFPFGSVLVYGGSSCLTRAPWLACMLGWEDVHIFGGDSSFTKEKTHVYGGNLPSNRCFTEVDGQLFWSHKVMMVQATDMIDLVQSFPGKISIHGDGLMPALARQYKNTGIHEWLAEQEQKEILAGMNRKERRRLKAMK